MSLPPASEFDLIREARAGALSFGAAALGIGDDCAILNTTPGAGLLVTTDMLMDGRHFRLEHHGAALAGYKAMAVNVSDIAAMAGVPRAAVVAVALPRSHAVAIARALQSGIERAAREFRVELVGGDTNAWDGPLVVAVTLLGEAVGPGAARRSGALPGDQIFVTGPLGGSLLGRHLRPRPRVGEALRLHEDGPLHALIDLSDGLASDLAHILTESGDLGALLDLSAVPIHPDARALSLSDGRSPLDHALSDGEDFELCLCVPPEVASRWALQPPGPFPLHRIGSITSAPGLLGQAPDGRISRIRSGGFDHLA